MRIYLFGCGGVGKCVLDYIPIILNIQYKHVTIIDCDNKVTEFISVQNAINNGATFKLIDINKYVMNKLFDELCIKENDILIDLTTDTNTYEIFKESRLRGVFYINTSIENKLDTTHKYIYMQHNNLIDIESKIKKNPNYKKQTCLIEFGMNPGLISLFSLLAIKQIAKDKNIDTTNKSYRELAKETGVKIIHCAEIDTQEIKNEEKVKEILDNKILVNTWSCVGLIKEGFEPPEISLNLHDPSSKDMIEDAGLRQRQGYIYVGKKPNFAGKDFKTKSICPIKVDENNKPVFDYIEGRIIHHGEVISMERLLSDVDYCPTMHYVYRLNPLTNQLIDNPEFCKDETTKIVMTQTDFNLEGGDNCGALVVDDNNDTWWCGSILHTDYVNNKLNQHIHNPTVMQVMCAVLGGVTWMLLHNNKGLCFADDVDPKYILCNFKKYLGVYYCGKTPLKYKSYYKKYNNVEYSDENSFSPSNN